MSMEIFPNLCSDFSPLICSGKFFQTLCSFLQKGKKVQLIKIETLLLPHFTTKFHFFAGAKVSPGKLNQSLSHTAGPGVQCPEQDLGL